MVSLTTPADAFCSKDPIGFKGGDPNVFRYVRNRPVDAVDPRGLKCEYFYFMADYFNLKDLFRRRQVNPEFDKCDRVAPICCWIEDGKQVCRDWYEQEAKDNGVQDPIIPNWPVRDNLPLEKDDGYKFIIKVFSRTIPGNMRMACRKRNKCDCGDTFSARVICDGDMGEYLDEMVSRKYLPHNPCGRVYDWNCKSGGWDDLNGKPVTIPTEDAIK